MKKMFYLLALLPVILFSVSLTSCSKDDDELEAQNVLYGTKWQAEDWLYQSFWGGGKTYAVLDFTSNTTCDLYNTQQGYVVYDCGKFSYTISGNTVTFKSLEDGDISTYTISGRKMTKNEGSNHIKGGIENTFIKQ
ncbi:MAG: hypothetical protein J6S02_03545 [Bacteroidaceae bacterium]|nr:hypothetical protein [Bacteroidaceae bacterium]